MSSGRQKDEETFYLDKFLRTMNWDVENVERRERPDFVVTLRGSRIGIEVTMFHSNAKDAAGRTRRATEEDCNKLQKDLMREVEKHSALSGVYGFLRFKNLEVPSARERSAFIQEVIDLSLAQCPSEEEEKIISLTDHATECPLAARYLEDIRLVNVGTHAMWAHNLIVAFAGPSEDELAAVVQNKVRQAEGYDTTGLEELWLLIVSGELLSQATRRIFVEELNECGELNGPLTRSAFNKTFFFQYMRDRVSEFDRARGTWSVAKDGRRDEYIFD